MKKGNLMYDGQNTFSVIFILFGNLESKYDILVVFWFLQSKGMIM